MTATELLPRHAREKLRFATRKGNRLIKTLKRRAAQPGRRWDGERVMLSMIFRMLYANRVGARRIIGVEIRPDLSKKFFAPEEREPS